MRTLNGPVDGDERRGEQGRGSPGPGTAHDKLSIWELSVRELPAHSVDYVTSDSSPKRTAFQWVDAHILKG
jgi:hypothetical protein